MRSTARIILALICSALAVMWVYALFFASKEAVNKIGDTAWTQRAEQRCLEAERERETLADYRLITDAGVNGLRQRADIVDKATDTIDAMLATLRNDMPSDEKGRAIVPMWLDEYEQHVADRREYATQLRDGNNAPFSETTFEGLPLAERLATFAGDNRMPACAPPIDLSV
ncbi:MAG: hypothetical protein ACO3FC_03695 [Ilumatobacteraceae bacterium]